MALINRQGYFVGITYNSVVTNSVSTRSKVDRNRASEIERHTLRSESEETCGFIQY